MVRFCDYGAARVDRDAFRYELERPILDGQYGPESRRRCGRVGRGADVAESVPAQTGGRAAVRPCGRAHKCC